MATTQSNQPYRRTIEFHCHADWRYVDVEPCRLPSATAFGPMTQFEAGDQVEPRIPLLKPVMYLPVKRKGGTEIFPGLAISLALREHGNLENVTVPAHQGAKAKINVFNVWSGIRVGAVALEGTLDARGSCLIKVPPGTVGQWLDPTKSLNARINEALLEFTFSFPDLKIDGAPIRGQSKNRVYLYRRKVIVFLPGVFGSNVQVIAPDGRTLGYPDYYDEPSTFERILESAIPALNLRQAWSFLNQRVGGLECDAEGKPLLEPLKPTLFRLRGLVYGTFDECRAARMRYFKGVPKDFRLVEIHLFAYDWRTDLTATAKALAQSLIHLQRESADNLRGLPDFDDEIAVAGHSTGGLLIRRALGEPGMQEAISHAFFLNVPFRGAPKALAVALTGKDPPGGGFGNRMIPFVESESLRALALGMPIVYHLAPSSAYNERVALTPNRPAGAAISVEDDKRDLIATAIETGFLAPPMFVKASGLSTTDRAILAASADRWNEYWADAFERSRADDVYATVFPNGYPKHDRWRAEELTSRGLEAQFAARAVGGWNLTLAARARKFHEESEAIAGSNGWASKAYIFYSLTSAPTTLRVQYERVDEQEFPAIVPFLASERISVFQLYSGDVIPLRVEETMTIAGNPETPAPVIHQWKVRARRFHRITWRLHVERAAGGGDSTVPTRSLLGFGAAGAKVLRPIPKDATSKQSLDGPKHTDAANAPYVWDRIMEILQGTIDPANLQPNADTLNCNPNI